MTVNEFLVKKLNAKQKAGAVWESHAIWPLSRLRELVPDGKCENHPHSKGIALVLNLDDGRVIVVGNPKPNDSIEIREIVGFVDRPA